MVALFETRPWFQFFSPASYCDPVYRNFFLKFFLKFFADFFSRVLFPRKKICPENQETLPRDLSKNEAIGDRESNASLLPKGKRTEAIAATVRIYARATRE